MRTTTSSAPWHTRSRIAGYAVGVVATIVAAPMASAAADKPDIERASYTDRYQDDFILDLCGIETWTTITERWSSQKFADGSETFHVVRTFVSDDPRIPVEKGAATSFLAPDGSRTVAGKPTHLFWPGGGTMLIDAGRVTFDATGNLISIKGPHPSLDTDLTEYYCPR